MRTKKNEIPNLSRYSLLKLAKTIRSTITFEDLKWLVAYRIAEELKDFSIKELARSICGASLQVKTWNDVLAWFDDYLAGYDNYDDPGFDWRPEVKNILSDFFLAQEYNLDHS
jgi:hypothetical protein